MQNIDNIQDELISTILDGSATLQDVQGLLHEMQTNPELCEVMKVLTVEASSEAPTLYPMMRMVAEAPKNLCAFYAELFIMKNRSMQVDDHALLELAHVEHWITEHGTPLYAVGQLLASQGLMVTRQYDATLEDISEALHADNNVLTAVDNDKLYPNRPDEEDAPNHVVVILSVDQPDDTITLYEPQANAVMDFSIIWCVCSVP